MELKRGQKLDITKGRNLSEIAVVVEWKTANSSMEIDTGAFLLEENGKCNGDESFIFYGQPLSVDQSVRYRESGANQNEVSILLNRLSNNIKKIAFTLTIHEGETRGQSFSEVSSLSLKIKDKATNGTLASFLFGEELHKETAIVAGELYLHNSEWKFNAIGSGFFGGLAALCTNFGIEVEEDNQNTDIKAKQISYEPVKEEVYYQKEEAIKPMTVTLEKKGSVSIKKTERVVATLEWESKKDLDLYCFYVLKDGTEGKVYYRNKGNANTAPFITLDGDSIGAGKETIIIHKPSEIKYVLFSAYSAISNGFGSFKSMKARAVVDNQMGQTVTSPLYQKNNFAYWVAIAHIDFTNPSEMKVNHVETYSKSGTERSPLLYADGSFKMNVGPMEFK